jgi:hypothetical protein
MNETLQKLAEKAVENGTKTVEQVVDFIKQQTPEVLDEVIRWGVISELPEIILSGITILICVIIHLKYSGKDNGYTNLNHDAPPGIMFNAFVFVISLVIFTVAIGDVLYPLVAPRLYIMETISELIK